VGNPAFVCGFLCVVHPRNGRVIPIGNSGNCRKDEMDGVSPPSHFVSFGACFGFLFCWVFQQSRPALQIRAGLRAPAARRGSSAFLQRGPSPGLGLDCFPPPVCRLLLIKSMQRGNVVVFYGLHAKGAFGFILFVAVPSSDGTFGRALQPTPEGPAVPRLPIGVGGFPGSRLARVNAPPRFRGFSAASRATNDSRGAAGKGPSRRVFW